MSTTIMYAILIITALIAVQLQGRKKNNKNNKYHEIKKILSYMHTHTDIHFHLFKLDKIESREMKP